jgi:hypothetical protein
MEDVGIFIGPLVYFTVKWYRYFMAIWYIFSPFWYVVPRKIWQPWLSSRVRVLRLTDKVSLLLLTQAFHVCWDRTYSYALQKMALIIDCMKEWTIKEIFKKKTFRPCLALLYRCLSSVKDEEPLRVCWYRRLTVFNAFAIHQMSSDALKVIRPPTYVLQKQNSISQWIHCTSPSTKRTIVFIYIRTHN